MKIDAVIETLGHHTTLLQRLLASSTASPVDDVEDILPNRLQYVEQLEDLCVKATSDRGVKKNLVSEETIWAALVHETLLFTYL